MAQLVVNNLDEDLVQALKQRAAARNRSVEEEHRAILQAALLGSKHRGFAAALGEMPYVGEDADFARDQESNPRT